MRNRYVFIFLFLGIKSLTAQVGIGTTNPTADLDIDGTLRIRNTPVFNSSKTLNVDGNGNVGVSNNFILSSVTLIEATAPVEYDTCLLYTSPSPRD